MKTIILNSITLSYFKGIKSLILNFDKDTIISACNGAGKSTIADAFLWVLFDKDTSGRTKFRIRTLDSNGKHIPHTSTFVELHLSVADSSYTIRKELHSRTSSPARTASAGGTSPELRGNASESTTARFYANGQSYTKTDFSQFVRDNIITEDTLRTITSPQYFFSLPWDKQLAILVTLAKEPDLTTLNTDGQYDELQKLIDTRQFADIDAIKAHAAYNIKVVKQQLDLIPLQIQEQTATMPPVHDWDALSRTLAENVSKVNELQKQIQLIRSAPEDANRKHLRQQIEFQRKRIDDMRTSAHHMASENLDQHNAEVTSVKQKLSEYKQNLLNLGTKLRSLTLQAVQIAKSIEESNAEQEKIRTEWHERVHPTFIPHTEETCAYCGQPLPIEKLNEIIQKQREVFNNKKAEAKKQLNARAEKSKRMLADAENEARHLQVEIETVKGQQTAIHGYVKNQEARLNELLRKSIPTAEDLLNRNPGYADATNRIKALESQLNPRSGAPQSAAPVKFSEASPQSQEAELPTEAELPLIAEIERLTPIIDDIRMSLATRQTCDTHLQRIDELEQKNQDLTQQYADMLRLRDLCHAYTLHHNEVFEQSINQLFTNVSFTLFRHLVNGNVEPTCEALVNGVPVATNVNHAALVNAGLEIINVLSRKMGISAPIFIDNAESVQHILPTVGQQIRLYVGPEPHLTIKN